MITNPEGKLAVYANTAGAYYGRSVVKALNDIISQTPSGYEDDNVALILKEPKVREFPNTMLEVMLNDSVRGEDAYLIQWFPRPPGEEWSKYTAPRNKEEFFHTIGALQYSGVRRITLVTPYAYDQRNDVQAGRQAIGASLFGMELRGVADTRCKEVLCLDMHAQQVVGTYEALHFNMTSVPLFDTYVNFVRDKYAHILKNALIAMPDVGSSKRGRTLSEYLGLRRIIFDKERISPEETIAQIFKVGKMGLKGKTALVFDDVLGTGGTAAEATRTMIDRGVEQTYWFMSHLEGADMTKLDKFYDEGLFKAIFIADTVKPTRDYFIEVPTAPLMARLVYNIHARESLSPYLMKKPREKA
jgi:ribose-phosphate pyrophosphokinase